MEFREREDVLALLGIGKPSRGEPIPDKYKAKPLVQEAPAPEQANRFAPRYKPRPESSLQDRLDYYKKFRE